MPYITLHNYIPVCPTLQHAQCNYSLQLLPSLLLSVDYTCSSDGEGVNATSGSAILGGALWCGFSSNVLAFYGDVEVGPAECKLKASFLPHALVLHSQFLCLLCTDCHPSCKSCSRSNDSTACTSCTDSSHEVVGGPFGPCQPPGKSKLPTMQEYQHFQFGVCSVVLKEYICAGVYELKQF